MFKIGEIILYGSEGVCKIHDVMKRKFMDKEMDYYVLRPINTKKSVIYIPTHSQELICKMQKILSSDEIEDLIETIAEEEIEWNENDNQRKMIYKDVLKSGDRVELMRILKSVYLYQQELEEEGKKLRAIDDNAYKEAEKIIYEEFAYVLEIEEEDVFSFIMNLMKKKNKVLEESV